MAKKKQEQIDKFVYLGRMFAKMGNEWKHFKKISSGLHVV